MIKRVDFLAELLTANCQWLTANCCLSGTLLSPRCPLVGQKQSAQSSDRLQAFLGFPGVANRLIESCCEGQPAPLPAENQNQYSKHIAKQSSTAVTAQFGESRPLVP